MGTPHRVDRKRQAGEDHRRVAEGVMPPKGLERILVAIGKKHIPAELDRAWLVDDLDGAGVEFRLGAHFRKQPANFQKNLERMAKHAQELIDDLRDDDVARAAFEALPEDVRGAILTSGRDLSDMLGALVEVPVRHVHALDKVSTLKRAVGVGDASAFRWLVGTRLREIYERHFQRKAGVSRDATTKRVGGPYIRFANATLRELGIKKSGKPYSLETIAAALNGLNQRQSEPKNTI